MDHEHEGGDDHEDVTILTHIYIYSDPTDDAVSQMSHKKSKVQQRGPPSDIDPGVGSFRTCGTPASSNNEKATTRGVILAGVCTGTPSGSR